PQLEHLPHIASADVNGGKIRQINIDVDREALKARQIGVQDVVKAVAGTNVIMPSGNLRAGPRDYNLFTNTQVLDPNQLGDVVIKGTQSGPVHVRDIAHVVDGAQDQTNIVRLLVKNDEGQFVGGRGVFLRILK